jgi:transposase
MGTLSKSTIEKWILPHLPLGKSGFETTVPIVEIVECILYRLKTGCQWRELPTRQFFTAKISKWGAVFHYFNKWSKAGCWKEIWVYFLKANLQHLDLSSAEFDGSARPYSCKEWW